MGHAIAGMDVVHHNRKRREIERHVVTEGPTWSNWNRSGIALPNQIRAADIAEIRIEAVCISTMNPVVQHPRNIIDVGNPEDQGLVWIEITATHLFTSQLLQFSVRIVQYN